MLYAEKKAIESNAIDPLSIVLNLYAIFNKKDFATFEKYHLPKPSEAFHHGSEGSFEEYRKYVNNLGIRLGNLGKKLGGAKGVESKKGNEVEAERI